jgi:hypothetical protein
MSQPNKGKLLKMKTEFNKNEEIEHESSNENFTFDMENNKKSDNDETIKKPDINKVFRFRNTVDTVEIQSMKVFDIDLEEEPEKEKSSNCVNHCFIY